MPGAGRPGQRQNPVSARAYDSGALWPKAGRHAHRLAVAEDVQGQQPGGVTTRDEAAAKLRSPTADMIGNFADSAAVQLGPNRWFCALWKVVHRMGQC